MKDKKNTKKKISIRYFMLWTILTSTLVVISIFPEMIVKINKFVRIKEPVHLVFLIVISFLKVE